MAKKGSGNSLGNKRKSTTNAKQRRSDRLSRAAAKGRASRSSDDPF